MKVNSSTVSDYQCKVQQFSRYWRAFSLERSVVSNWPTRDVQAAECLSRAAESMGLICWPWLCHWMICIGSCKQHQTFEIESVKWGQRKTHKLECWPLLTTIGVCSFSQQWVLQQLLWLAIKTLYLIMASIKFESGGFKEWIPNQVLEVRTSVRTDTVRLSAWRNVRTLSRLWTTYCMWQIYKLFQIPCFPVQHIVWQFMWSDILQSVLCLKETQETPSTGYLQVNSKEFEEYHLLRTFQDAGGHTSKLSTVHSKAWSHMTYTQTRNHKSFRIADTLSNIWHHMRITRNAGQDCNLRIWMDPLSALRFQFAGEQLETHKAKWCVFASCNCSSQKNWGSTV